MTEASGAPKDGNEADPQTPFCAGEVGMMSTPGWVQGLIEDPETGCPDMMANVGVFALPGSDGGAAPVLLGGSDIAVAAKSANQDLAKEVVALMLSDEYQTIMAESRAHARPRCRWPACSVTTSSPQATILAGVQRQAARRRRRAGLRWRAPGSSRTCSWRSRKVATSPSWRPPRTRRIAAQLN